MDEITVLVVAEFPEAPTDEEAAVAAEIWVRLEGMVPVRVMYVHPEAVDPDNLIAYASDQ